MMRSTITGVWQIRVLAQDIAVKESLEPPHLASKVPFASVQYNYLLVTGKLWPSLFVLQLSAQ
jgi:hypothetical protein